MVGFALYFVFIANAAHREVPVPSGSEREAQSNK